MTKRIMPISFNAKNQIAGSTNTIRDHVTALVRRNELISCNQSIITAWENVKGKLEDTPTKDKTAQKEEIYKTDSETIDRVFGKNTPAAKKFRDLLDTRRALLVELSTLPDETDFSGVLQTDQMFLTV